MTDPEQQQRAPRGGVVGVNGEFYEGGKFLPTRKDRAKRAPAPRESAEEVAERRAQAQARAEQAAQVAAEPGNAWVAAFLAGTYRHTEIQRRRDDGVWVALRLSAPYEPGRWPHVDEALERGDLRAQEVWSSEFAAAMHARLTEEGVRVRDFTDRMFGAVSDLYCQSRGASRGKRGWRAAQGEFYEQALGQAEG